MHYGAEDNKIFPLTTRILLAFSDHGCAETLNLNLAYTKR